MTHVLVTGGAGFIGSHLVDRLLADDYHVTCIDEFNDFYDPKIKEQNVSSHIQHSHYKLERGDICDKTWVNKIFQSNNFEFVVHLAARAGVRPSITQPELYAEVNILGTINLLERAKQYDIKKFIFCSSSAVYGNNKKIPFSENDPAEHPISPYAATKKSAEQYCYSYHLLYGLPITVARLFTVYGPRQRPDLAIHKFTKHIYSNTPIPLFGDGSTSRDYTYVSDTIAGIVRALQKNIDFEIINLGNSYPVKLIDLVHSLEDVIGKKAKIDWQPMQPGDVNQTYADISKAKKLLGYQPKVSIKDGLKKFMDWYRHTHSL